MRSLKIEGNSTMYIKADSMELNLELVYENPSYTEANQALRQDHLGLIRVLNDLDFESGRLKTTSNQIQVLPAYDKQEKRFRVSQNFIYRDKLDMDKLSKLLDKITMRDSLNFSIAYYNSKMDTYEEDALVLALKNANKKAKVIARAAKVDLDKLESFEEINSNHPTFLRASIGDTMPDDLKMMKTVSVVYGIK